MERQTEAQTVMTGNKCLYDLYATVGVDDNWLFFSSVKALVVVVIAHVFAINYMG